MKQKPCQNEFLHKKKQTPKNKDILKFIMRIKFQLLVFFIHVLNCRMSLFFGICFFLCFLKFSAGRGFL